MGNDKDKVRSAEDQLRSRAEEALKARASDLPPPRTEHETQRLVHELEVHQIELEMQNAELRLARDEVETVLQKYADLYDFAPIGYFTLDRDGAIGSANLAGATLLGVERSRLLGRLFGAFVSPHARPFFAEFIRKVFAVDGKESCELALVEEGGQPHFVQIEAVAESSGKGCRFAVIDITKRKRIEEELAQKKREIEEVNRNLELRIVEAVDELRKKDQMLISENRQAVMGEMINNIAHQWRQPLNALGLIIQQVPLFYDSGQLSTDFLKENTEKGMALIQHMSRTMTDFMNFFKTDKERVDFSINQTIAQTLFLFEGSFREQNIDISFQPQGDPMAHGSPNEYAQVLLNILMNARDALVGQNVEAPLISIHSLEAGGKSVVTIADNAGGIDEGVIGRLFDPYFTTKGPAKGTGIGLFMSKAIVEKSMGGRLTVRNNGGGAEFRIEI